MIRKLSLLAAGALMGASALAIVQGGIGSPANAAAALCLLPGRPNEQRPTGSVSECRR